MLGLTFTFKYILKDNQFFSFSFNKLLKTVYGFCYNIASVLRFGPLSMRPVGSLLPVQESNAYPLH